MSDPASEKYVQINTAVIAQGLMYLAITSGLGWVWNSVNDNNDAIIAIHIRQEKIETIEKKLDRLIELKLKDSSP
jgi:nitroreductase